MTRLIDDMLFLAQSDQEKNSLEREPVRLEQEAHIVSEFLTHLAEDRNLKIRVAGHATVSANRLLVQRALTNVLSNAVRHATAGTTIDIAIELSPLAASLAVVNTGKMIARTDLTKIFERFYRVEADRSRDSGGSGLGLPIVQSIMRMHDGDVVAESAHDGRTVFRLTFPIADQHLEVSASG